MIEERLATRRGLLDAVVFSGGEPLAQRALPEAVARMRALGFSIGLHSAGPFPRMFERILPLVDWVGFDVKTIFADYTPITGVPGSGARAEQSLKALLASGVDYEIRTTLPPGGLPGDALEALIEALNGYGVKRFVLQEARTANADADAHAAFEDAADLVWRLGQFAQFDVRRAAPA